MKWGCRLVMVFVLALWSTEARSVVGDLNRDGVVDFDDFFIFADNFGKEGVPQIIDTVTVTLFDTLEVVKMDTVMVTIFDTLTVTETEIVPVTVFDTLTVEVQEVIYDTLVVEHATVFDTVILGREPVRYDPPPPPSEISAAMQIRSSLQSGWITVTLLSELRNSSSASLERVSIRLTVRNSDGVVIHTKSADSAIRYLVAGDTRIYEMSLYGVEDSVLDNIRSGNFTLETAWHDEVEKVNNVSLKMKEGSLYYGSPFAISGEIENTTDLTVESFTVRFFGRDASGSPLYFKSYADDDFGIQPGGSAPFTIDKHMVEWDDYLRRDEIAELYYCIDWRWKDSSYLDTEVSPLTRLF